ncbi:MAG: hypothetical protein ACKVP2_10650 [Burkholderiales bacterium]
MQKQTVPGARFVELLNEEIQRHPFYKKGMSFTENPTTGKVSRALNVTWDKKKWGEFDFVFAAAHRVIRSRYETR